MAAVLPVDAGLVVVTSAGNLGLNNRTNATGYTGITSPGNAPSAITVGALDTRNTTSRQDDEVTAQIGQGGMAEVFRAFDTRLKRPVAVKVLRKALVEQPSSPRASAWVLVGFVTYSSSPIPSASRIIPALRGFRK